MTLRIVNKKKISVQNIGTQRFWIGIIAGFFSAVSISLFIDYSREALRLFTIFSSNLLTLSEQDSSFYNLFFSGLSSVLGLSITIQIWMSNTIHERRKDRIYKQVSKTNILLIFWAVIMIVSRIGSIIPIVLFSLPDYDNQFNLDKEFWLLFVLLPLVIFMQNWFIVRLIYKASNWIILSFFACVFLTYILSQTTSIKQENLNNAYPKLKEKYSRYNEQEIKHKVFIADFNK